MLDAVVDINLVKTHRSVEKESNKVEQEHLRNEGNDVYKGNLKFETHYSVGFDLDEKDANHKEKGDEEEPYDGDKTKDNFIIVWGCPMILMNWLIAHEDRDVSCGYVPALCHPLRKLGEEEQVNVCGDEKDIRVGEWKTTSLV